RLFLLTVGAWGARRLYRQVAGEQDGVSGATGRVAVAVAYVANPYVLVAGSTLAILLPWAFLPWQTYALVRALEQPRTWRWPALFALSFAAMSGANAGVVPIIQLVSVPAVVGLYLIRREVSWGLAARTVARCAALCVLLSLYWVIPSISALQAGATVVANSESFEGIANPSSAAEVLRGLGLWPLYGADDGGPWLPEFVPYLTSSLVVVASFALPVLAFLSARVSPSRVRSLSVALVAVTVPVMVGLHPPQHPTPFGTALRWVFDNVPGAGAFRTTNKAGAVLVLGLALLAASGASALSRRVTTPAAWRRLSIPVAGVLVVSTLPAFTGNLYTSPLDIPGYWRRAAVDLDRGPSDQRIWFIPGEALAQYRWSVDRPDDLSNSLMTRPALIRTLVPVTSAQGANLLAAIDGGLNEGALPPGTLSTAARYLGAGDLLLRNDVVWENVSGGRPSVLQPQVNGDPGLVPVRNYGQPGENTASVTNPPESFAEAALPPLQHYRVRDPVATTRPESLDGMLLIDGDGYAVPELVAAGLTDGRVPFRYLGDLARADLRSLLGPDRHLVLTDTNRRRTALPNRLADGQGPLLGAAVDPGATRALFGPRAQTVLTVDGGTVEATAVGGAFGTIAAAAPENAFDGDLRTSWQFGDFRNAPGERITLHLPAPRRLDRISITQGVLGSVQLDKVTVTAGDVQRTVRLPDRGSAAVDLGGVSADTVAIEARSLRGEGFNRVGIAEVSIPGVRLTRVARMPERLSDLAASLDASGRQALAATPLDVLMSRVNARPSTDEDDEERFLARDFRLPDARSFTTTAVVRVGAAVPDPVLDRVAGYRGPVEATSSSRAFDAPMFRASRAIDGDPRTAWSPNWGGAGQSLTITAPPRRVDHVDVVQTGEGTAAPRNWATRVQVELDGRVVRQVALGPGRTRIGLPARTAQRLVLRILATKQSPSQDLVRFSEVDFAGAVVAPGAGRAGCATVSTLDGQALSMRPEEPLELAGPATWVGCGRSEDVSAGEHSLRPAGGWVLDRLRLADTTARASTRVAAALPSLTVRDLRGPAYEVRTTRTEGRFLLVLGEGYDPRWRARIDGRDAGAPLAVDGYTSGWVVDGTREHVVRIWYGPQRSTTAALAVSAVGLLVALILAFRPRGRQAVDPPASPFAARRSRASGSSGRRRRIALWSAAVVLCAVLGGVWIGAAGAVLAVLHIVGRAPRPRTLMLAAAGLLAAVPVLFIVASGSDWGVVSANLVVRHPWPHRVAALALLLLVVGVVQDERLRSRGDSGTLRHDA
ncbi:MAG TPA: alpha-(1-_3)-arabinofuranosyltransferase family protein, partial [Actinomycetes bacterium]